MRRRSAVTLVELMIFLGILGLMVAVALPLLFRASENRVLQHTISIVEQNGTQLLQQIAFRAHGAEKILEPLLQSTGSVLALQTASGGTNPTIFGVSSGSIILVNHATQQILSSTQVAVEHFLVRNTSISSTRQSFHVSFEISRTTRLQSPRVYRRTFETVVTLYPDDTRVGAACGCAVPSCDLNGNYVWQVCENQVCLNAQTQLECP